ncbi:MAG TPA: TonB-dependent receptor [Thermoanaerobaculia bacterium]|nr:TonB-dependent receptor [Thermoanaerobaculia bacterium]
MRGFRRFAFVLLCALAASRATGQTTSSIVGRVADDAGVPLPGVTVEATSPALQGSGRAVTDAQGRYRLSLLPPGTYTVTFAISGFASEKQTNVVVALGRDTSLSADLHLATKVQTSVTSEASAIELTSSGVGTSLDQRAVTTLPTGRNYSSVAQVVPGVSSDANPGNTEQATITVYGSSGAENSFYIDGVNTTGAEYGFQGKELNFEFIQAVDVKTGGYEAEFGRSTGGIVNVITKSGGNDFHGDVFGYYDGDNLQANAEPVVSNTTSAGYTRKDFGIGIGGYILKDRLWFFGAYDRVDNTQDSTLPEGPRAGQVARSQSTRDLGSGKLTFKASQNQTVTGTVFLDPRDDTGAINDATHSLNGDPLTYDGKKSFGGTDYALRYEGLFGARWLFTLQGARHQEKNEVGPASAAGDVIQYRDVQNNFYQTGGFGLIQNKSFTRDMLTFSATAFLGAHEAKFGVEYERESADVLKRYSGGQQVDVFANPENPAKPVYSHFYWTTPNATVANAPVSALNASPEHKVTTLYLQDKWTVLPNLTVNIGLRWDRQEIVDASGVTQIDLKDDFAPRFGFAWDATKDAKTKIYGSYGRYYEQLSMDLVIRSFSYERQPRIFNYSPTSTTPDPAAEADLGQTSNILGGFTEPSDPNLRNQYIHEYVFGAEREVAKNVVVGIKGIYRNYGEVIEDFLCADDGTYCIGNPGKGIMERLYTLDYSQTFASPEARRTYKAVQLDVTKSFADSWWGQASYIYSKLEGNFDGLYSPFTNVGADPNISAAFDYYDFFTDGKNLKNITNDGPLSNDRRHQFKVSGYYVFPFGLSVGAAGYYRSGTPVTRYGYSDAYGRYEFFMTPRGAEGRAPDNYDLDLHLGYPIALGPVKVNVLLDVFNLFNTQKAILLDQRYGFQEDDNSAAKPVNRDYLQPVLRTPPTTVRLGARVSF